ncbi:hypothetical protein HRW18_12690 [Streptomyces lunaelactis]|uniref:hypothetical protein n=1 Tax=Streptomyces lunaelactis TaxID=1535768 RepID=UPI00158592F0|nr:hypothetical protein [Streptomyces lunaelactis]NUK08854.1 hypothetical protein [Streptomyces lunaelactis]NUK57710.1 hypothetical protein [Streptomyces lunaelactis]NUL08594.1 hypothetical protein [Streptomyces lunaelactis]
MAVWSARKSKGQLDAPQRRNAAATPPPDTTLPATTGWLLRGKDGRLTAYAPTTDGVLRWTETRPGGPEWSGPDLIPAPGVLPYLSIAQGADGYVHLLGLRRARLADGRTGVDVVHALQYQSGLAVRDWHPLGTPYPRDPDLAEQIGLPSGVVNAQGSLHVFVRNACAGVCGRSQGSSGRWGKWADLKGKGVLGTVSASTTSEGLMEILATTADGIIRWEQETAGMDFQRAEDIPAGAAADSLTAERTGGNRLTHFWHDADDHMARAWRPSTKEPITLGTGTGTGPVALLRTPVEGSDCTILARRDAATGRPALAAYPTEHESLECSWTLTGERCAGAPALAIDGRGRIVMAAFGTDGTLRVARQKAESGLALEAWARV